MNDTNSKPPDHLQVDIAHEGFAFRSFVIEDPVPTGKQLLDLSGARPAREHLLFQWLPSGAMEEIRPDEVVDLRISGRERFITFKSDRSFRFQLDDESRDWGAQKITGMQLKQLAKVNASDHDVFHLVVGGRDQIIEDNDAFDLGGHEVERFATREVEFEVFINTRPFVVHQRTMDFQAVVRLEHPDADFSNENVEYTVTYDKGPRSNRTGNLVAGQSVNIKGGMEFYVLLTDKS